MKKKKKASRRILTEAERKALLVALRKSSFIKPIGGLVCGHCNATNFIYKDHIFKRLGRT